MKGLCVFLLLACFDGVRGQVLSKFPASQHSYIGGDEAFYQDFQAIARERDLENCAADQFYQLSLLINPDGTVNFIADHNKENVARNQCAYNMSRSVVQHMTKWNAATVRGEKRAAVATFFIHPAALLGNDQQGYVPSFTPPAYGKSADFGAAEFRKGIVNRIDLRGFSWDDLFNVIIDFIITKDNKIDEIIFIKSSGHHEFDKRIAYAIMSTQKKWRPAAVDGKPVDFRYRLELNAVTDPE